MPLVATKKSPVKEEAVSSAASRLRNAFDGLNNIFVSRENEVKAITLATVAGAHVLLQGSHGIAKSDIAREAHRRITGKGLVVYDKMFSKGTKEEDVFGPVNIERYKKEAVWQHNTALRLPTAHFANLEELGRASDFLLPAMMTVLNERLFHNGNQVEKCPLISAIATTNFMSDDEDLEAFKDRWLIRIDVKGVETVDSLINLLKVATRPRPTEFDTVTLSEILHLNEACSSLPVEDEVYGMYARIISDFRKQTKADISDRRAIQSLKLAKAYALLEGKSSLTCEELDATRFGLLFVGQDAAKEQAFDSIVQNLIGTITVERKERRDFAKVKKYCDKLFSEYDADMPDSKLKELRQEALKWASGVKNRNEPLRTPGLSDDYLEVIKRFEELAATIASLLSSRI